MAVLPQRFFPPAEREQFVIDLWLPEGSKIEFTDALLKRVERELASNPLVASYGTFVGSSAPRFYYNVDPQQPAGNYGQILVNTRDSIRPRNWSTICGSACARSCPRP